MMMTTNTFRKTFSILLAGVGITVLSSVLSCSSQQPQAVTLNGNNNDLLPKEVVIKYEHNLSIAEEAEKIKGIDYVAFITELSKKVVDGTVTVYDPMNGANTLAKENIDFIFESRMDTLLDIDEATLDTVPTVKKYDFSPSEVQRLVLKEDWYFNVDEFKIQKTVLQYAPIRISKLKLGENNYEIQKQMLFWIKPGAEVKGKKLIASDVTYEFDLYNMTNPSWMESLSVSRFVDLLLDNVLNGKVKGYDFFSTEKVALSVDIIRENLGATIENLVVEDDNNNVIDTVQIVGNIYPDEIRSVIFVEDWFVDENMMIHKVVKRIAPVRHYYMLNDLSEDEIVKKIPFVVDLNY